MSDVRAPGNPGGTRGKSCAPYVSTPLADDAADEGSETSMGMGSGPVAPTAPGKTSGRKGNPVK